MRGDRLRRHLGEHQKYQREYERSGGQTGLAEELKTHQRGDGGAQAVGQNVADQDHAEQSIGAFQQPVRFARAGMTFFDEVREAIAVQRHHRGFGTGEKCRQQREDSNRSEER